MDISEVVKRLKDNKNLQGMANRLKHHRVNKSQMCKVPDENKTSDHSFINNWNTITDACKNAYVMTIVRYNPEEHISYL